MNRLARLQHQAQSADKHLLRQTNLLIQSLNESNVVRFCESMCVGPLYLEELLQCHELRTDTHKGATFQNRLFRKLGTQLKRCAALRVRDRPSYEAFAILFQRNQCVHRLCVRVCSTLSGNAESEYQQLLLVMQPKLNALNKKYPSSSPPPLTLRSSSAGVTATAQGFIYMIRTRACVNSNESVFKVGKTRQAFRARMAGYDKGYETVIVVPVPSALLDQQETMLLQHLRQKFVSRTDYGAEYFEGERMTMTREVLACVGVQ
jgi:hypothetical protein